MDSFVEQLVTVKSTTKIKMFKITAWIVMSLIAAGLIFLSVLKPNLSFFLLLIAAAAFFLAYYMCSQLNIEYEYVVTNKDVDIDRIINKRKRQCMASFSCSDIENVEKYDSKYHTSDKNTNRNVYFACTPDANALAFTVRHPKKGSYIVVMTPNDDFKNAVKKYASYTIKSKI